MKMVRGNSISRFIVPLVLVVLLVEKDWGFLFVQLTSTSRVTKFLENFYILAKNIVESVW